ncbi:MAG: arginine--tRNA ligase [Ignavibacteriales bacterium]|nr:arginine--tRNA ligase [Ignavibacteriales bacterium]
MKQYLQKAVGEVLSSLHYSSGALFFEKPKVAAHGDLTTNIAMLLAKEAKKNPRQVAQEITGALHPDPALVAAVEIAGPGFINFRFTPGWVVESAKEILRQGSAFGKTNPANGRLTNVEWVSANPTGPLHSGHGRQVILGYTVANLLEWTGHAVTREYYFNNAGNQMLNLGESIYARYRESLGDSYAFPENGYAGEYIKDIAAAIAAEHGDALRESGEDKKYFRQRGEEWCFASIKKTLERLGVRHDVYYNEDSLYSSGKINEVIEEFRAKGLAYDLDGAVWLKATELGLEQDRVIVKSTGEPTYRLPDIAYHREKFRRGFDLVVDIFGADHIATIPDVLAGVRALGYETENVKVIIHQMVSFVEGEEVVKMSKRSAKVYTLDELIDEVGADAVHYFFVMRSANTHLEFDIELAKEQSDKNPLYYLQYAHARIASILRFAQEQGYPVDDVAALLPSVANALLKEDAEVNLLKLLLDFPEMIQSCAFGYEPHRLTTYLREVAEAFHRFYHDCRVLGEDKSLSTARVALCLMAKTVIFNGCTILGVSAPEKM